jgi:hypothetical protein
MNSQSRVNRRRFFLAFAGLAGLGGVLANTLSRTERKKNEAGIPEKEADGYRLSPHIKKYYSKARI